MLAILASLVVAQAQPQARPQPQPAQAPHRPAPLTIAEAVQGAIARNQDIAIAASEADEAEKLRMATRGGFGPIFKTEANLIVWDDAYSVKFPAPDALAAMIPGGFPAMNVRDRTTRAFSFSVIQPITPLYSVSHAVALFATQGKVADARREVARLDAGARAEEAFFSALAARRFADIAVAAHDLAKAHLSRAKTFQEAGLIHMKDVLTAEVRVAQAHEAAIRTRANLSLARMALQIMTGVDARRVALLDERTDIAPPTWKLSMDDSETRALASRPELSEVGHRREMARRATRLAWGAMLPTLAAVATYQHSKGVSFQDEDQFFGGITLSWNAWEWGSLWHKLDAARIAERRVDTFTSKLVDVIRLQVRQAFLAFRTAQTATSVAVSSIPHAEEQLRLAQRRFDANATSSTEVLDAQLLLTQARTSLETARIGAQIALAALRRAVGDPSPWMGMGKR